MQIWVLMCSQDNGRGGDHSYPVGVFDSEASAEEARRIRQKKAFGSFGQTYGYDVEGPFEVGV